MVPVGPLAEPASPQGVLEARSSWAWWACLYLEALVLPTAVGGPRSPTAVAWGLGRHPGRKPIGVGGLGLGGTLRRGLMRNVGGQYPVRAAAWALSAPATATCRVIGGCG